VNNKIESQGFPNGVTKRAECISTTDEINQNVFDSLISVILRVGINPGFYSISHPAGFSGKYRVLLGKTGI